MRKIYRILPALLLFSFNAKAQAPKIIPVVVHILHEYGPENINDLQVRDAINVLNEDFGGRNADTSIVIAPYKPLIANCNIQFRLATKDPNGNCTNGIEHIYTHNTAYGDDAAKISQWPRDRYLNIWVVKTVNPGNNEGLAGFAYEPSLVTGPDYNKDGIMINNAFFGSIGTASVSTRHVITHLAGHYLGLLHPDGGNACMDGDGIADTPPTSMNPPRPCNPTPPNFPEWRICDTSVIENVQNFMLSSYCSVMFTPGQATFMNQTLTTSVASRDNLCTASNLTLTGTDSATYSNLPLCKPVADFFANKYYLCEGGVISFTDVSWCGTASSRSWTFSNGTPSTSTAINPTVQFNTWGWQQVSLTVSNSTGSDTKTVNNYIFVSPPWYDYWATFTEDLEASTFDNTWIKENMENTGSTWQRTNNAGVSGTHSILLNDMGEDEGLRDVMISPSVDLSTCSNMSLNFKYACASSTSNSNLMTEMLKVYASTNCGATWMLRKVVQGTTLINNGMSTGLFVPGNTSTWTTCNVALNAGDMQANVRFRFEFTAGGASNSIYIDDINLSGTLGVNEYVNDPFHMSVFPNPSAQQNIHVNYFLPKESCVEFAVKDILGRAVFLSGKIKQSAGENNFMIPEGDWMHSGIFFIEVKDGEATEVRKLVIGN
ncbi:MAG TPA: M43 family zinc metalloprotease [Bacteroidia bacterium]|jgi:PKD repeat protein